MGKFPLIRKKERYSLTWPGRLLVFLFLILLVRAYMLSIVSFLSPNQPVQAGLLVVEGFLPDYALSEAIKIFDSGDYDLMVITGKEREIGAHLDAYANDGEYSAATLIKLGFDSNKIIVVPTDNDIKKDRTYYSAIALKSWIEKNKPQAQSIDLVSLGCHSRRSLRMFTKVLDNKFPIGNYSVQNQNYDPDHWWKTSYGVREVTKETIAWIYARFFFYP